MHLRHDMIAVFIVRPAGESHEFLQLRRSAGDFMGGTWQTVCGRIEAGETAIQAAVRELREETGLVPLEFYQLDRVNTFFIAAEDTIYHSVAFCAIVPADASITLDAEHDAWRWVAREEVMEAFLWPGEHDQIAELCRQVLDGGAAKGHMRIFDS